MTNRSVILLIIVLLAIGAALLLTNTANKNPQSQNKTVENKQPNKSTTKILPQTTVTVTENGYVPARITIKAGTKVTWLNKSGKEVTVHSADHPSHLLYTRLNLGQFPNGSSVQLVFDKAGKYKYHNHLNPIQTGEVIVE